MQNVFMNIRKMIDSVEKNVDLMLANTKTKPFVYATAASYLVDGDRKLTSAVVIAKDEHAAINRLKVMVANNNVSGRVEYISLIANKVSGTTLDRIKKDC